MSIKQYGYINTIIFSLVCSCFLGHIYGNENVNADNYQSKISKGNSKDYFQSIIGKSEAIILNNYLNNYSDSDLLFEEEIETEWAKTKYLMPLITKSKPYNFDLRFNTKSYSSLNFLFSRNFYSCYNLLIFYQLLRI